VNGFRFFFDKSLILPMLVLGGTEWWPNLGSTNQLRDLHLQISEQNWMTCLWRHLDRTITTTRRDNMGDNCVKTCAHLSDKNEIKAS